MTRFEDESFNIRDRMNTDIMVDSRSLVKMSSEIVDDEEEDVSPDVRSRTHLVILFIIFMFIRA
jgi:hypothetical protein